MLDRPWSDQCPIGVQNAFRSAPNPAPIDRGAPYLRALWAMTAVIAVTTCSSMRCARVDQPTSDGDPFRMARRSPIPGRHDASPSGHAECWLLGSISRAGVTPSALANTTPESTVTMRRRTAPVLRPDSILVSTASVIIESPYFAG